MLNVFIKTESWDKYSKLLFMLLFVGLGLLGLLYIYFMNLAVFKTAQRNFSLDQLSEVKMHLQSLEENYINKLDQLNVAYAKTVGFVEAEPVKYIYQDKAVAQYSNHDSKIR